MARVGGAWRGCRGTTADGHAQDCVLAQLHAAQPKQVEAQSGKMRCPSLHSHGHGEPRFMFVLVNEERGSSAKPY